MTEKMKEKRRYLSELSRQAKEIREKKVLEAVSAMEALDFAMMNINSCLRVFVYGKEHNTYRTYKEWTKEGYQVKKGSKAFLFWARPLPNLKREKAEQEGKEPETEDEYNYFPLCYLFSNKQVEKIA